MQLLELLKIAEEVKTYVSEKGKTLSISRGKILKDYEPEKDEKSVGKIAQAG